MAYDPAPLPGNYAQPYPSTPAGTQPDVTTLVRFLLDMGYGGAAGLMPSLSGPQAALTANFAPLAEDLGTTEGTNAYQDNLTIMMDNASAMLAGPGAYAPGAFDDIMSYETIPTPGVSTLERYAQNPDSIEGMIAAHLLAGGTTTSAIRLIRIKANRAQEAIAAEKEPEAGDARVLELLPMSPAATSPMTGATMPGAVETINWGRVDEMATEMDANYQESLSLAGMSGSLYDDAGNMISAGGERKWVTDANGNRTLVEVTSKPSDAAEEYISRGLSLPTEEWSAELLLGGDWAEQGQFAQELGAAAEAERQRYLGLEGMVPTAARRSEIDEMPWSGPPSPSTPAVEDESLWDSLTEDQPVGPENDPVGEWAAARWADAAGFVDSMWDSIIGSSDSNYENPAQEDLANAVPEDEYIGLGGNSSSYGSEGVAGSTPLTADIRAMLQTIIPQTSGGYGNPATSGTPVVPPDVPYDYGYWAQPAWSRDPMQMPGVAQPSLPNNPPSAQTVQAQNANLAAIMQSAIGGGLDRGRQPQSQFAGPMQAGAQWQSGLPPNQQGSPTPLQPGAQWQGGLPPNQQGGRERPNYMISPGTPGGVSVMPQVQGQASEPNLLPNEPQPSNATRPSGSGFPSMFQTPTQERMIEQLLKSISGEYTYSDPTVTQPPSIFELAGTPWLEEAATRPPLPALMGGTPLPETPADYLDGYVTEATELAPPPEPATVPMQPRPDLGPGSEQPEYLEALDTGFANVDPSQYAALARYLWGPNATLPVNPGGGVSPTRYKPEPDRIPGSETPAYLQWLRGSPRGHETAAEMAVPTPGQQPLRYSGPEMGDSGNARRSAIRLHNEGEAKRARGNRNQASQESEKAFRSQLRGRAVAEKQMRETYGRDYGRAQAIAYLLNSQGMSPTMLQLAARNLPAAAAGVTRG